MNHCLTYRAIEYTRRTDVWSEHGWWGCIGRDGKWAPVQCHNRGWIRIDWNEFMTAYAELQAWAVIDDGAIMSMIVTIAEQEQEIDRLKEENKDLRWQQEMMDEATFLERKDYEDH